MIAEHGVAAPGVAAMEWWIAGLVGGAATVEDLRRRTISNWLSVAAFSAGLVYQTWSHGPRGAASAVLGAIAGFLVFLVFYLLGGMGGGDVKLMAGFGALLGIGRLLPAAFWTALTGGLLAAAVLGWRAIRVRAKKSGEDSERPEAIPYAPAIFAGVLLTLLSSN